MPCPQNDLSIQYVTSVLPSMTKLAMLPTSRPSTVMTRFVTPGDVRTFAMWRSNAVRSSGSSAVKAAIRTDSGSRICANKASRSESSNRPQRNLSHKRPPCSATPKVPEPICR
jgi:hypothetical protein